MEFVCGCCNYSTSLKSNYTRHLTSLIHIQNAKTVIIIPKKKKQNQYQYKCECGNVFSHASGLSRHKKTCQIYINSKRNTGGMANENIIKLQTQIDNLTVTIESMSKKLDTPKHPINNYNLSVKNYAQMYYAGAPTIASPADYAKLTYDNKDLIDILVYHHTNKTLHKHIGDFIIGYYKKDDPALQSLWASDTARLTYIVKEALVGKESIWNHDPKGAKVKKYIVKPILDHIDKAIETHWSKELEKDGNRKTHKIDVDALAKRQKNFNIVFAIRKDITDETLANDIIRYIAPVLHMNITNNQITN